jgi:TctA family transporter
MSSRGSFQPFLTEPISLLLLVAALIYAVAAVRKNLKMARLERARGEATLQ